MAPPAKRAAASTVPKKGKAAGGGKRQPPKVRLPEDTELTDLKKQTWRVGRVIGEGGFGLVYLGSGPADCVIKAEPKGNGPLFCEMHFYQRAADGSRVADWARQRGLEYVGVPRFYGCGHHAGSDGTEHRFLVIERLGGGDLERQFEAHSDPRGRLPPGVAFAVALRVLEALEFVHDSGYAHADVKASNLLISADFSRVYLSDYGLAFRYFADGRWLKEEKEDPKRRHDGTAEYCSRDAHRGLAPTPRADLENLAWCLLAWLTGPLPWQPYRDSSERVQQAKTEAVAHLATFLRGRSFARPADSDAVGELLRHADGLGYHERPQYQRLRDLLCRRVEAGAPSASATVASATAVLAAAFATAPSRATNGAKASAVAKASPRPAGAKASAVAKASPRPAGAKTSAVAKASPRPAGAKASAVAKASPRATVAKPSTVAKASPRSTGATSSAVAKAASPPSSSRPSTAAAMNGDESASTSASRKRKSGSCQTSPHLLKEAKRMARRGRDK